ncbi:unnamed protein product [Rotaria socialis]|uniref:Uncharacterized protein n=1 Tax=Rotaria socialis TaxID=392032 RepID=A0A817TXJ3_9BILA|nr:unnamed protein product [Rotaria socialis]CAF4316708.1 unnamed protein product [Rotaria socialis]CAF4482441.1 unnamed protein product [Rotaria socialis]CAF4651112.1 unnamed protein product [Rotaria socialis]
MSNTYNNLWMIINPLLSTFPAYQINIQPYWIVAVELIVSQLFQRIWHHFKYGTWFTTLEIAGLIQILQKRLMNLNKTTQSSPTGVAETNTSTIDGANANIIENKVRLNKLRNMIDIDYFDAINCLLILGHAIWYCVIQSTCSMSSSSIATPWNCYNVFVSYSTTTLNCIYKTYMLGYMKVIKIDAIQGSLRWLIHYAILFIIIISLVFVTSLMLPFILTHVVPMFIVYIWMSIIYIGVCIYLALFGFEFYDEIEEFPVRRTGNELLVSQNSSIQELCSFMFSSKDIPHVLLSIVLALVITKFPILLSIFFNYTQSFYYGESYLKSIVDDYKNWLRCSLKKFRTWEKPVTNRQKFQINDAFSTKHLLVDGTC